MADSAVRFLLLSTTLWTLLQAPEIQAQTNATSILTIHVTTSPFSVSPSSSLATPSAQTSAFSSNLNSTIGYASSITAHSSSVLINDTISTQSSAAETIAPSNTSQQTTSSTPASPSQSVTSSPTTKGSEPDEDEKEKFTLTEYTLTEYILIACLGSFVFVLIAIIFLVIQIKRLSKSVRNLKATSNR